MYIYIYSYVHMYVQIYIYVYTYICIYIDVYVYVYIYVSLHMYTYYKWVSKTTTELSFERCHEWVPQRRAVQRRDSRRRAARHAYHLYIKWLSYSYTGMHSPQWLWNWRMRHVTDVWLTYETCYQCLPGWCDVQRRDSRWCAARAWCFGHALRALRRWAPFVLQWCVLQSVLQCMLQCVSQCEWGCFGHALRAMRRWAPCVLQCALRCVLQYVLQRVSHVALVTHYRLHVDEFVPNILIYIHVYLYLYVNMYLYIYVHMHVYMRIWIHMYAWIFVIRRWVRAV